MDERRSAGGKGCVHRLIVVVALLWFGTAPIASPFLVDAALGGRVGAKVLDTIAILVAGLVSIVPLLGVALLVRRRAAAGGIAAVVSSLTVASGYLVLDAAIGRVLPQRGALIPLRSRYTVAALRLAGLLPYAAVAAWLGPRLAGLSGRSMREWLGLGRPRWSTCLLALTAAGLLTVPWPITGALGDSLSSLAVSVQMLTSVVPQMLIFWGVVFVLLTTSFARTEVAAMTTILIYTLSVLGRALTQGGSGAVTSSLFLLPLAFLLTEMRARGGNVLPLLPLAFCYRLAPALFVDPRDAIASGIPELQHVLSYLVVVLVAVVVGMVLWMGRRVSKKRRGGEEAGGRRRRTAPTTAMALLVVVAWGLWTGLYWFVGEPGFFNHGFLIILKEQADLRAVDDVTGREARLRTVYRALVENAEGGQRPIRRELDHLGVPYRSYYIINMVRVDGHRWLMDRFEGRPEVADVILNPNVRKYPRRIPLPYGSGGASEGTQGNLTAIHADAAWELGVVGQGIVVGGQDTGYDWDHPALKTHYRGWDDERVDHNYNWHDAWDDTRTPFDDGSHGTHTMGTVLGDDGGENRIGVAPEATWIGCRNMRRGFGNPGSYAECMEFLFAPYPLGGDAFHDGDVGRAVHVINNSWGCPPMEGCLPDTLRPAVEALRAAGIMMVVSAGNEGPACGTASAPPARYDASFTVGATTEGGDIVGFSSRGPVHGLIKPDIAAPGQQVRSSVPGGGYGMAGGTSMAGPHVAGAVALVWSADKGLLGDIDATEEILCRTAVAKPVRESCENVSVPEGPLAVVMAPPACACGGVSGVPNNVYGCGVVDAGAAVKETLEE